MDYSIFVKEYNEAKDKAAYVKKHIMREYLGYADKTALAKNIARVSTHIINDDGSAGAYKRDTMSQYFHTQMNILTNYTDIIVEAQLTVQAYDELSKCGAMDKIIEAIPKDEILQIKSMVQMAADDVYVNERDIASFFETKIDALSMVLDTALSALQEVANKQDNVIPLKQ